MREIILNNKKIKLIFKVKKSDMKKPYNIIRIHFTYRNKKNDKQNINYISI